MDQQADENVKEINAIFNVNMFQMKRHPSSEHRIDQNPIVGARKIQQSGKYNELHDNIVMK